MGKGKRLTEEEIGKIKAFNEEGLSNREISRRIGRSPRVVNNFLKDPENYGKKLKGGVKTATTERERRSILREASNSSLSARQIGQNAGISASVRTVQRVIKASAHLQRRRLRKKPKLTPHHKENRLRFAQRRMAWTTEWRQVIFSDEKRFSLDGPDCFSYYFHDLRKEQRFISRRHSRIGGVMVWAAISYYGPIDLVVLTGKQTAAKYKNLLSATKFKIQEVMGGSSWIFQQDSAPIHTARVIKDWFREENIQVLDWPSLSPDLNIIENLWGWLSRRVFSNAQQYNNTNELITAIEQAWAEVPITIIQNLYDSLPNRIFEVINKNGGNINY